ncbi:helix-turn-helix domain-containing protein [Planctomycetota bacterium]
MAGMFYSLQEVAEKLNKTTDEVKAIVQEGKLREFRDGPNLLFKVDEVEAMMSDTAAMQAQPSVDEPQPEQPADEEIMISDEALEAFDDSEQINDETILLAEETPADEEVQLLDDAVRPADEPMDINDETVQMAEEASLPGDEDMQLIDEDIPVSAEQIELEDALPADEELTQDDTVVDNEGLNVLDETGGQSQNDYLLADDSMDETHIVSDEASLEEIEEDINLDTFGSGSGLLDLSLQADDTSLGGILDEIYTPEGEDQGKESFASAAPMDIAAQTEEMLAETEDEPAFAMPSAARAYEPEPDAVSNAFGIMMFLPLLAVIYTAVIMTGGIFGVRPAILDQLQGLIWYIVAGIGVLSLIIVGIPALTSGSGSTKTAKAKPKKAKTKKEKAPKKKKEKKPKKQKKKK